MLFGTDLHMPVTMATNLTHLCVCVAEQQATSHSVKLLDMLLHSQQVMPPYGYICDVKVVQTLIL